MLLNGDADLAFFNLPVKNPDIDYQIISHEEVVLVLGNDHPLKNKGIKKEGCKYPWLDLKLLENEPFILQPPDQRTRQTVDQLFKSCHIHPQICLQTGNIPAAAELASQGYGACFVTETHLKHIPFKKKPVLFLLAPQIQLLILLQPSEKEAICLIMLRNILRSSGILHDFSSTQKSPCSRRGTGIYI